jgi:hypothetical protein
MRELDRRYLLIAFICLVAISGCGSSPTPSPSGELTDDGFPSEVLGLPVLSVGGANRLIAEGRLDGRVAAVGGWWLRQFPWSCPMRMREPTALETFCTPNVFASRLFATFTCTDSADGSSSCSSNAAPPGTDTMNPALVSEASAADQAWLANAVDPKLPGTPMVLIGHAKDPRMWNCPVDVRDECAGRFVVDAVIWVNGREIPLTAAIAPLMPLLTVDQVSSLAVGESDARAIVATALRGPAVGSVDPRVHGAGDAILWLVRTIGTTGVDADDPTRSADVLLIDDATGEVIKSLSLQVDLGATPEQIIVQATFVDDCCPAFDAYPFYRIERRDGSAVAESSVNGASSTMPDGSHTRFIAGPPVFLDPGDYVVKAWRAAIGPDGSSGVHEAECTVDVTVAPAAEIRLEAAFPDDGPCRFVNPTFENLDDS